jgi:hypothetical protein
MLMRPPVIEPCGDRKGKLRAFMASIVAFALAHLLLVPVAHPQFTTYLSESSRVLDAAARTTGHAIVRTTGHAIVMLIAPCDRALVRAGAVCGGARERRSNSGESLLRCSVDVACSCRCSADVPCSYLRSSR